MERRNLIRLLVGLGLGIPIAVEAITYGGLIGSKLSDRTDGQADGGTRSDGTDPGSVTSEGQDGDPVEVGDDILPATPQSDTVTEATIESGDPRTFRLRIAVENTEEEHYELQTSALTMEDGTTIPGGGRTGQIPPGGRTTLSGHGGFRMERCLQWSSSSR